MPETDRDRGPGRDVPPRRLGVAHHYFWHCRRLPRWPIFRRPGEVLPEDFLKPFGMGQYALAKALDVPEIRISEIVRGKRALTPETALRLARYAGTSAEFWLGMQTSYDLELAHDRVGAKIEATVHPRAA